MSSIAISGGSSLPASAWNGAVLNYYTAGHAWAAGQVIYGKPAAVGSGLAGHAVTAFAGAGDGAGAGGNLNLFAGYSYSGTPGRVNIYGGNPNVALPAAYQHLMRCSSIWVKGLVGTTGGNGYLWGGRGAYVGGNGGNVGINGGWAGANGGNGGYVFCVGGRAITGVGGPVEFTGGYSQSNTGGFISMNGGYSYSGTGGRNTFTGGYTNKGTGGTVYVQGGNAHAAAATGTGGSIKIYGGNGATAGTGIGGDVIIKSGTGGNHNGRLILKNLPVAAAGLPAGSVWNNAGVLNIV